MKFFITLLILGFFILNSCQTIEKKSKKAIDKENEELSKFLQQPASELKIIMGVPDEIAHDGKGSKFFVYSNKKYGITCERKFEIDKTNIVVGFTSKGCF